MADNLPVNFPIPGEQALATYNFSDFAQSRGVVKFYLLSTKDSTGLTYKLSEQQIGSPNYDTNNLQIFVSSGPNTTNNIDVDFDLTSFNNPVTIEGKAIVFLGFEYNRTGANGTLIFTLKLRKWDGSTETDIATVTSETFTTSSKGHLTIPITIPNTHFKIGETLRFSVLAALVAGSSTSSEVAIGIDPLNRDSTNISPSSDTSEYTQSYINIPFRITL